MKIRLLFSSIVAVVLSAAAFAQTYTFTNAGATGRFGPTQVQCDAAYGAGVVTVTTQGIQEWVVPVTGVYSIEVSGAAGGSSTGYGRAGGLGARVIGEFSLSAGMVVKILVGQEGETNGCTPGGGGGTFVVDIMNNPLIIAGGGGAASTDINGIDGNISLNGGNGSENTAAGGTGGMGGSVCLDGTYSGAIYNGAGGAGFIGNGQDVPGVFGSGGLSFVNGGIGGQNIVFGGFGGGGSSASCTVGGGGGGGYSGGAGGEHYGNCSSSLLRSAGGGGGSFNSGSNQTNIAGANSGMGYVVITNLCSPTVGSLVVDNAILPTIVAECSASSTVPTATNSCGTINGVPNVTFPITTQGTTVVTWTYNDGTNTITQTQNVIIDDVTNPTLSCPANINVNNSAGNCSAVVSYTAPVGTDNCAGVITTQTAGLPTGSTFPLGTTTNTFLATDAAGNTSSCSFNVVVTDNELPVATCQNAIVQLDGTGNVMLNTIDIDAGSFDNCGIASLSLSQMDFDCSDLGSNTVTLTVLDVNGNSNTCSATVTIQDLIPLTVTCLTDITVNNVPNNCGRVVTYTVPVATDNCAVTATQTDGTGFTSGDLFPVGTTIQQYTYTDAAGNTVVCSFNVIVLDVQNPTITPLTFSNITVNNTLGMCGANVPWLEPTASDNCPGVILTASNTMGSFFPIGTTTVTYTATDASLNTTTLSFDVTVIDNEFPTITCPADIAANTDAGQCYATVSLGTPVATDNCLITSLTSNAPVTFPVGTTTVVWTAVDNQGNTVTCNQLVTVTDIEMPIAACQNISINLDGTGNVTIVAADIDNASSDACGVTLSASQTAFTCANVGANTVTLTVTDANGNVSTCTSTVTVVDNIAPIALCQNTTVQLDVTGNASITGASVDNGSTDNCAIASMTVLPNAFTCANIGANPVVLTVTDVNGNVSTCNATVTIEDNVTPVALCQNVDVFLDATGNGSTTAALVDNGSSDACGIASLTLSQTTFDCSEVGLNPVTLTVVDNNGNSSTCTADVNVIDNIAPVAVCQDITVQLDASGVGTIVVADINNGSSDACGIATMTLSQSSFSCTEVGTKLVTLTVTDVNGNSSTCTSTLTIEDNIAPIAVCQDITVQLDASGNAAITGTQINNGSSDACGIATLSVSPSTFDCTNIGGNAVVLTVTDVNGNASTCNATVTVQDNVAPTAVCQNITLFLDGTGNVTMVAADIDGGSIDACGIASLAASQTAFTCASIGANNVVLTVTDLYGNTSNCTAVVTVLETTPPVAVCQNISINLNAAGLATILPIDLNNGSTDNCSIANYSASQTSFDCTDLGANTVTLTVTDGSGNATTCSSIVTVSDIILPTAICQDITVNLNAAGTVSITPNMINNGSFDNCTIATISASQTAFTCANVGPNNLTLTITDQSGNTSTCTSIVTVTDNIAPTAICQNATANLDASGNATIVVSDINDGSFDNCGILSTVLSMSAYTCANVGPNPVTLTVTDVNGNVSTCSSTVTVIDAIDPTVICQNISVNLDATGNTSIVANDLNNGSFDNCGIASLSASQVNFNCSNVGANNIILTATDVNGNTNTCTSVVTVIDAVAPNALCQNISVNLDATGNATITGAMINNGSSDACGIASLVASPAAFTCANVGPNTVTLTVLDVNGNSNTCISTVNVIDNIAPTALCQNFTVNLDASGNASIASTDVDNGSFDNCGIATLVVSPNTFTCSNVGANPVVLTVTDVNGLVSSCTASVTVVDNTAPTAICQDITVNLNSAGNATITGAMINNGSFDNCAIASLSVSPSSFNCANVGANPVVLTVTDVNGNSSTCSASVTVVDNMLPTAICQNQTINLDATGNAVITAAAINNGSFDNCGIASLVASQTAFTCANVGANTVTLTVTDVNGNVSTCTSTITVIDNLAPTAICQNISVNLDVVGSATITAAMIDNGSNDNCAIASLAASQTSFNCSNVGSNNVTLTVLDVNGNSSTCNSIVTIVDNIAPTANCQNISINLNAAGNATITAGMINLGSSDNCGIASLTASQTNFNCSNVGTNNVTLTVMDVNLNTSTCMSVVTVIDNIAPVAVCQNISVNLDATGNATITGAMVNNGSTDACGIASLVVSPSAFTCANVGANPVVLTVTDVNGNSSTCSSVVTVIDNIAPTAVCQNITVNLDATGNAAITAAMINNGSTDNCSVASIAASTTSFTCANVGPNTVTLTVTDVNGNVSACNAVVTVVDVTAPAALCQNQTLTLDIFGNASTTAAALNNGSSDECGIASVVAAQTIYDCSDLGANNITLTVTDVNGNISTCNSVVTVQDLIAPTIVTQDITVALDASGSVTITGAMITAAAFDNCAITSSVLPTSTFDCTDIGPNTVTLIVSDASGNTAAGTAVVTVIDNMAPTAICQNVTINLDATGNASITEAMINNGSTDNCGIATVTASQLNFTCAHIGNNNVTLTVTDVNGNVATCLAVVTVLDPIAPVAVCQNVTLNLDANGDALLTPSMVENGSSDNCTIAFTSVSQANFTCANTGANNITYTVTDNSGNSATCVSVVTIIDNTAPNAICENITVVLDATGNATITAAMINNGSNDNCSVTLGASQTAFACANVGANNVVLTVTDPSGNVSTCTAIVTVVDNTTPVANCQNITINLDAAGMATITGAMIDNGSTDACGIASVSASQTNFTCANVGPNNVTLTVTDVNGNTSTCTSIVTVVDNINPTAICQNVTISLNPSGAASITSAMINNGSFDNCAVASISASQTAFDCTNLGANNVTLTVTDVNGNVGTCVAIVTVIDGIAPVITCPSSVTVNADAGICGATVALTSPIATDNCTATITNNAPVLFPLGTTTVIWTATDAAGNTATCSNTVTVLDNQAPTITCPANITVNTDANICFATGVNLGTPVTADNCTVASVTNNAPSVFPLGTTTITWTVVDQAGNTSTCTQTVTVVDNQAPVVVCTSDIVLETVAGSCGRVVNFATPLVVDNCSVISMTQSDASGYTSGDIFPVGTTVISYTAVDGSGNTYTCSFNVTIEDNQHPVLTSCPADITVSSSEGTCDVVVSWVSPTANDNCPGVQLTTTHPSGSLFGPGTTVVTYQAMDNSGNITACSFNVTVLDGNAPIVPVLADVYNSCQVNSLPSPVADDICAGEITGTTTTIFPITTVGIIPVVWTFNDGNGNISTATQYVYIDGDIDATVTIVNDVTLMANNTNATYQWIDCATGNAIPGATNQTFVATVNGDYAVVLTENGCPAETSDCISIRNVGIEDVTFSELSIYPNPSVGGVFTISFDGKIEKIEVVDMIGRLIAVDTNLENGTVNGSELASGKYFVKVYSQGQTIAKEVIVVNN